MAFAVIAAMNQLRISPIVVNTLYIGLVAAISLALGLAFGLGGRETAARLTQQWVGHTGQRLISEARSTSPITMTRTERATDLLEDGDTGQPEVTSRGGQHNSPR